MDKFKGPGDEFQERTKHHRGERASFERTVIVKPSVYKTYPGAESIELEKASIEGGMGIWDCLNGRRSVRKYTDEPVGFGQLSQVLWASQGITAEISGHLLRNAPSAGALYPVETYLVVNNVESLEKGIYHYNIREHALECLKKGDFSKEIEKAAMDQEIARTAGVVFIWSAVFDRCKHKYAQRAYRYIYLDSGHVAQNTALAAVALGLGSCPMAAYYDDEIDELLELDSNLESVIYLTVIGKT